MITVITKPSFITTDVQDNKIKVTTGLLDKKIRITARYKCCYCDVAEITFKTKEEDENI